MLFVRAVRFTSVFAAAFSIAGCSSPFDAGSGIGGRYTLSTVDGQALPCCTQPDPAGTRVTIVSGTLQLDATSPETFVATPAGMYPRSCVFEVPNGATVDDSQFPRCGDAAFTLTFTRRFEYANGTSATSDTTIAGKYAWSSHDPAMIKLVDAVMAGPVEASSGSVTLSLQHVNVMGSFGPTYTFTK